MIELNKRKSVDMLIEQFWKQGYLTVSRKFGTYLPEPQKVGEFEVDIVARQKKNYAIGITLTEDDFNNDRLYEKINFLATRQTKYSNKKVSLFIGVPPAYYKNAKAFIDMLDDEVKKNIKVFQIFDKTIPARRKRHQKQQVLFS